jgi:hypothetical protein
MQYLNQMKRLLRQTPGFAVLRRYRRFVLGYVRFATDYSSFRRLNKTTRSPLPIPLSELDPCLHDRTESTGFDRHYVYHTAWAALVLAATQPVVHFDIASSLYFNAIAFAFVPVRFFDYRPADLHLPNFSSDSADLLSLPFPDASIPSLSCMHVLEHVGLGRYGDPISPDADSRAMVELSRVLAPGRQPSHCGSRPSRASS